MEEDSTCLRRVVNSSNGLTSAIQSLRTFPTTVPVNVKTVAEGVPAQLVDEIVGSGKAGRGLRQDDCDC